MSEEGNKMKLEEIKKKYEELGKEIELLEKKGSYWKPKAYDTYYSINGLGGVYTTECFEDSVNKEHFDNFNFYKTKEEAEHASERMKIFRQLDKLADGGNCYLFFSRGNIVKYYNEHTKGTPHTFSSEEKAQRAINIIGEDRLLKYYFEVEQR